MTTTATKTPPKLSGQLRKLDEHRDELHALAREARATVTAYEAETEQLRAEYTATIDKANPRAKEAAELSDEIRRRQQEPNPHQGDYEQARDAFHQAAGQCDAFRRTRIFDLLAELDPDLEVADQEIAASWRSLVAGCSRYADAVERAREIVGSTPGLNLRGMSHDERPHQWQQLAHEALDSGVSKPALTPLAAWKIENQ